MLRIMALIMAIVIGSGAVLADEYRVTANVLNVRALPFTDAQIVGQVSRGDVLDTTAGSIVSGPDWIGVRLESGETGFVSSRFVERVRIDRFNADFLQVLPETPTDFIAGLVRIDDVYGLRYAERFGVSGSGRFLIAYDGARALAIFDTELARVTRRIDVNAFALTDNYLVYVPQDGFTTMPHLEYIDLRVSDTVRRIDPQEFGLRSFVGLAAIPNSDQVVTQVLGDGYARIVSFDLRRQQIDQVFVPDAADGQTVRTTRFFAVDDQTILGYRSPSDDGPLGGLVFAIDHGSGAATHIELGPEAPSNLNNVAFFPEEAVVLLQGPPADRSPGTFSVAIDYNAGSRLWDYMAEGWHNTFTQAEDGRLVSYENVNSADQIERSHDIRSGTVAAQEAMPADYSQNDVAWTYMSNNTTARMTITAGIRIGALQTPITLRIEAPGTEPRDLILPGAVRNMGDLGPDGRTLRLLVTEGDTQAFYEWDLDAPEPRLAQAVDRDLRWVSAPSERDTRGVIFNTDPGPRTAIATTVSETDGLADITAEGTPVDCTPGLSLGRINRRGAIGSDAGLFAMPNVCLLAWDVSRGVLQSRLPPDGAVPLDAQSRNPGCDLRNLSCLDYPATAALSAQRLDEDGARFWAFWSTTASTRAEQSTHASIVTYSRINGEARADTPIAFAEVVSFFVSQSDHWLAQAPRALPVASRDGNLRMFVHGMRPGADEATTWLFTLDRNGTSIADPRPLPDLGAEFGAVLAAYRNDGHYVISSDRNLAFLNDDLELIAVRPFSATASGTTWRPGAQLIGAAHFVNALSANIYEIYRLKDGSRAATFVVDAEGNALALTDGGYFAQNGRAAADLLILRNRDTGEALPISSVFDTLYRPDLVQEALIGDPDNRVGTAERDLSLESVMLGGGAPIVEALEVEPDVVADAVNARMVAQLGSGGIGNVIWSVNGVVVGVDETRAAPFDSNSGQRVEATRLLPLEPGENTVAVRVANHAGTITSDVYSAVVTRAEGGAVDAPTLYVMAIGVDDYEEERLRLNYSVNDARAVADTLSQRGLDFDDVRVTTLFDREVSAEALDDAFSQIADEIRPTDTFVFFLAGHGVTFQGRYYFLPPNISVSENPADSLARYGISQTDWRRFFSRISALRSVILFDSCESGSAIRMNAVNELEQGAGISRLAAASGRAIITAAAETQYALEGHNGHGAFTYTLLEAFSEGDTDADTRLDLRELADYVGQELPDLTQRIWQYRQEPQVHIFGTSFALARTGVQ